MNDKVLLIINTGTPDKPEVRQVRSYLSEFLNDKHVIDLPWLLRKTLVNLIIVPFRAPKSTRLYRRLWTDQGSPLLLNHINLVKKVQNSLNDYKVFGVMRYGNPSLGKLLKNLKSDPPERLIIFPLYPHYASSTTGSVIDYVQTELKSWNVMPETRFVSQFYSNEHYLNIMTDQITRYIPEKFDHILFSYHGLPVRHIQRKHPQINCNHCSCEEKLPRQGEFCYKATCYETTRLLAEKLNMNHEKYSTSFQSRLSKNWLTPFTDATLEELARSGKKNVLIISPSFVADCLETIIEIKEEYSELFSRAGGENLVHVESLNYSDEWTEALIQIAIPHAELSRSMP
jgi:ferrochelatase